MTLTGPSKASELPLSSFPAFLLPPFLNFHSSPFCRPTATAAPPPRARLPPSPSPAATLRSAIFRNDAHAALRAFNASTAPTLHPALDVILCNRLLRVALDAGRVRDALLVFDHMRTVKGSLAPTVVTYSTLLSRIGGGRGEQRRRRRRTGDAGGDAIHDVPDTAWRLYQALLEDNLSPDVVVFNSLISAAGLAGDVAMAWSAYREMGPLSVQPNVRTMNQMLYALASGRNHIGAGAGLSEGDPNLNFSPLLPTIPSNFPGVSRDSRTEAAAALMDDVQVIVSEMAARRLTADVFTYSTLCDIYADCGDTRRVFRLLVEMRDAGVVPNSRTWSAVVRACCVAGELERGREVLEKLLKKRGHRHHVSVHLYTILIDAYGKAGELDVAFELLADMSQRGFVPNAHTFSSVIHSCGRAGATDVMMEVFTAMQRAGVKPNEVTYSSIIYYSGRTGKDLEAFEKSNGQTLAELMEVARQKAREGKSVTGGDKKPRRQQDRILKVTVSDELEMKGAEEVASVQCANVYNVELSKLGSGIPILNPAPSFSGRGGRPLHGKGEVSLGGEIDVVREDGADFTDQKDRRRMIGEGFTACEKANVVDLDETLRHRERLVEFMEILHSHADKNELFQSFLVLGEMKRAGLDVKEAYNGLLEVCGQVSDFGAAVSAFEAMKDDGITPDVKSYTMLVRALSGDGASGYQQGKLVHIFLIFLEMQTAGVSPDLIFMNGMIEACRQCAAADKAREVFDSFPSLGLKPDAASYTSWVLACVACSDAEQAAFAVRRMDADGFSFDDGVGAAGTAVEEIRGMKVDSCHVDLTISEVPEDLFMASHATLLNGIGRSGAIGTGIAIARLLSEDSSETLAILLSGILSGACHAGRSRGRGNGSAAGAVPRLLRELRVRGLHPTPQADRAAKAWLVRTDRARRRRQGF